MPRRGMRTLLRTEVAATASGGEMMPPRRKPSASVKPGTKELVNQATHTEVKKTSPKASRLIDRRHFQNSGQEVCMAAS